MARVEAAAGSVLDHIHFGDARDMRHVADGEAQLVYLSPPYVGHKTDDEKEGEKVLLQGLLGEARRVMDPKSGFVVTYNTDLYDKGGIYARHDVVREAAETNGLKLYATKYHYDIRNNTDPYRMSMHHIQVFIDEGRKTSGVRENKKIPQYKPDTWVFDKKSVGTFRDAIPPEAAVIPIANFTEPEDLVVSQCAGSGTVVISALEMGRRAVGYEIEKSRAELMKIRQEQFAGFFSDNSVLDLLNK